MQRSSASRWIAKLANTCRRHFGKRVSILSQLEVLLNGKKIHPFPDLLCY
jgi:hypothetical protein